MNAYWQVKPDLERAVKRLRDNGLPWLAAQLYTCPPDFYALQHRLRTVEKLIVLRPPPAWKFQRIRPALERLIEQVTVIEAGG